MNGTEKASQAQQPITEPETVQVVIHPREPSIKSVGKGSIADSSPLIAKRSAAAREIYTDCREPTVLIHD